MQLLKRWTGRGNTRALVISTSLLALVCAPVAFGFGEGRDVRMGVRNPSPDQTREILRETQIFAETSTYGTRQSNKSNNGGGAMYGCRSGAGGSPANMEPCVRANNLSDGLAFEFNATKGKQVGTFMITNPTAESKPFTTNAPGVATGLNSDKVDGKDAEDFAGSGDLRFAAVTADAKVTGRGASAATFADATNTYSVTFDKDVSKCSYTVTQSGDTATGVDFAATSGGGDIVKVDQSDDAAEPVAFHLQVIC